MPLFILVILVGVPVLTVVWWWWTDWRLRQLPRGWWRGGVRAAVAGFAVLFLAGFGWFVAGRVLQWPPGPLRGVPGSWWMAVIMLWGLIVLPFVALPVMAGTGVWGALAAVWRRMTRHPLPSPPPGGEGAGGCTRREVLGAAVAVAPMVLTLGATAAAIPQKRRFRVRDLTVDVPGLPRALDGMRIAHVSDSHVGKFTHGPVLTRIADAVNRLDADLVLFTGDLIDYTIADLPEATAMLGQLQRDRLFVVEGNHDLFDGRAAFEQGVRDAGIRLLLDESVTTYVRGWPVQLLGVAWHGRGDERLAAHVARVAAKRDPDALPILLAHHPHAFDAAVDHGLPLTLAGHTHGGQLMLTRDFGAGPALFRYWSGLYRRRNARLVVSNGVGNWFPLRTAAPAEIVHLTLRCG